MIKLLHFADAHIDMANYGRHDPESGLPMRVMDFLNSLDEIVQTAIDEKVDLMIFAGDAYKDRSPAPTFQREWDRRIMRLSQAGIPTLLLTGNHDISPSTGRAHAIQEFDSLAVPHVKVIDKIEFLTPKDLENLPVQVIAIPWLNQSIISIFMEENGIDIKEKKFTIENLLHVKVEEFLQGANPEIPIILTAHASVEGSNYGYERLANISKDFPIEPGLLKNEAIDYVALGHVHKPQDINEGHHPPIIYPGSIERVDFGEEDENKFFIIAEIEKGNTKVFWKELKNIRRFITKRIKILDPENINFKIKNALPTQKELDGSIARLIIDYKQDLEPLINESEIWNRVENAFEFHLIKRPIREAKARLPEDQYSSSMSMTELLEIYLKSTERDIEKEKIQKLKNLAKDLLYESDK